jgi:hypothetical protein
MLMIHIAIGIGYCAEVANTGILYPFAGATYSEKIRNVEDFANALKNDNPDILQFFDAEGVSSELLQEQLLQTTTGVMVNAETLDFGAESLFDNLVQVGEFLIEYLV